MPFNEIQSVVQAFPLTVPFMKMYIMHVPLEGPTAKIKLNAGRYVGSMLNTGAFGADPEHHESITGRHSPPTAQEITLVYRPAKVTVPTASTS